MVQRQKGEECWHGLRRKCNEYLQTLVVVGWSGATILVGPTTLGAHPSENCMLKNMILEFRLVRTVVYIATPSGIK